MEGVSSRIYAGVIEVAAGPDSLGRRLDRPVVPLGEVRGSDERVERTRRRVG